MENYLCKEAPTLCLFYEDLILFLRFFIPLSLTTFIFAYREIKEMAFSLFKERQNRISYTMYFISSFFLLLWLMDYRYTHVLVNDMSLSVFMLITLFLLMFYIISIGTSVKSIFDAINIYKVHKKTQSIFEKEAEKAKATISEINHLDKRLKEKWEFNLYSRSTEKKLAKSKKKLDEYLHICLIQIEKHFQLILSKEKYKLLEDFDLPYSEANKEILKFIKFVNSNYLETIYNYGYSRYLAIYSTVLNYNILLLKSNTSTETIGYVKSVIAQFSQLGLNTDFEAGIDYEEKRFLEEYYKAVYSVILILSNYDHNHLKTLLNLIITEESGSYIDTLFREKGLLSLLASILYTSIDKNDLKLVTEVSNIIFQLLDEGVVAPPHKKISNKYGTIKFDQSKSESTNLASKSIEGLEELKCTVSTLTILFIIKAIEFGHYGIAGFLIKILVQRTSPVIIDDSLKSIGERLYNVSELNKLQINLEYIDYDILNALDFNFNFSKISFNYCFEKSVYLIVKQQQFLKKSNVYDFSNEISLSTYNYIRGIDMQIYIQKKVKGLNKEYGLVFLKD